MNNIGFSSLILIDLIKGEDNEETEQLINLHKRARAFIQSFRWSGIIKSEYFGLGIADIIGIFLFELVPSSDVVDKFLWVVVGDIPSAYLVVDEAPNAAFALIVYIREMNKWVDATIAGLPITDIIPVNIPPTLENAKKLQVRLEFLNSEILSCYKDDLTRTPDKNN